MSRVVRRDDYGQSLSSDDGTIYHDGSLFDRPEAHDCNLRGANDGAGVAAAEASVVRDGAGSPPHLLARDRAIPCGYSETRDRVDDLEEIHTIGVVDDWNDEPGIGCHGQADVDVIVHDDLAGLDVDSCVDQWVPSQRLGDSHHEKGQGRQAGPSFGIKLAYAVTA